MSQYPGRFGPGATSLKGTAITGFPTQNRQTTVTTVESFPSVPRDQRVKLYEPTGNIVRTSRALAPLAETSNKVIFPYTPEISVTHQANYDSDGPTHSNYQYHFYKNSQIDEINITAVFTAQDQKEANYVLAVQHFFRSVTKMFYGQDEEAGLPPPVCRLEGHGDLMFSSVPVLVKNFSVTLPSDVDYISGNFFNQGNTGRVPTHQTMTIGLLPVYSRSRITQDFGFRRFANGDLIANRESGTGGFI